MNIAHVMTQVAADCETDAAGLDGKPFTGRNVAETFGATLAMLSVVARAVAELSERLEARA